MEDNPLERVVDNLVDGAALITSDLRKRVWIETTKSYSKAMIAGATTLPISFVLAGTLSISQERMRQPEDQPYVLNQSQGTILLEPHEVAASSGSTGPSSGPPPIGHREITYRILQTWSKVEHQHPVNFIGRKMVHG